MKHKQKIYILLLHFTFLWPTSVFHYHLKSWDFSTKKFTFLIIDSQVFIYLFSPKKTKEYKMSIVAMLYLLRRNTNLINRSPYLIWELCWMGRLSVDSDFWSIPHMKLRYIYVYHHIVWLHWWNNCLKIPKFCLDFFILYDKHMSRTESFVCYSLHWSKQNNRMWI